MKIKKIIIMIHWNDQIIVHDNTVPLVPSWNLEHVFSCLLERPTSILDLTPRYPHRLHKFRAFGRVTEQAAIKRLKAKIDQRQKLLMNSRWLKNLPKQASNLPRKCGILERWSPWLWIHSWASHKPKHLAVLVWRQYPQSIREQVSSLLPDRTTTWEV